MKLISKLLLSSLALGTLTSLGIAQDSNHPPAHRPHPPAHAEGPRHEARRMPGPPIVAALDANRDGVIDATELANAPAALLALDRNADGSLASDELAPPRPPRPARAPAPPQAPQNSELKARPAKPAAPANPAPPPPPSSILAALDASQDGVIDASEIANARAALLTLDADADGQLSSEEYQPQHRGRTGAMRLRDGKPEGARPAPRHAID